MEERIKNEAKCLTPKRTEQGKELRRTGVTERFADRELLPRQDGLCNTITSVQKDCMVMQAADELQEIASQSRTCNVGVTINPDNSLRPFNADTKAKDGISELCTDYDESVGSTNIAARPNNVYGDATQYRIRKLTPRECYRLMGVDDSDIDKLLNATKTVKRKSGVEVTQPAISKTQHYKLAGNSIVVDCMTGIFRTLLIPGQPENQQPMQRSLFD
jgi:site-specific DNA-cytosine methylase